LVKKKRFNDESVQLTRGNRARLTEFLGKTQKSSAAALKLVSWGKLGHNSGPCLMSYRRVRRAQGDVALTAT
jgi:hypothetical protein